MRDYRFDVARAVCMTYIVAFVHLFTYIRPDRNSANIIPACVILTEACLGLFSFTSGFLLGKKYQFDCPSSSGVWSFYKKRFLRIFPLFVLAAFCLWRIRFNGTPGTINGVILISPFVEVRPQTLWYIPIILYCYLITPLVSRKNLTWKLCMSAGIMAVLLVLEQMIPSIDKRLAFNLCLFLTGIVTSDVFDWRMRFRYGSYVKMAWVVVFLVVLIVGHQHDNFQSLWFKRFAGGIGAFALLFVCGQVSNVFFRRGQLRKTDKKSFVSISANIILRLSYASMAVYMFHRFFYCLGEKLYGSTYGGMKCVYMVLIVFPVTCVLSYCIQKTYDAIVGSVSKCSFHG